MTNNPTIDGVSRELRELLERVARPIMKRRDETVSRRAIAELRTLLDADHADDSNAMVAPAVERQEPVAHHKADTVAYHVTDEFGQKKVLLPGAYGIKRHRERGAVMRELIDRSCIAGLQDQIKHLTDGWYTDDSGNVKYWPEEVAALQSTIAQLQAEKELMLRGSEVLRERIAELESGRGERQDGSALMKIAADLANRHPLRQLYLVCERQGRINTDSLHEHIDKCGDLLAAIALDIRKAITAPPAPVAVVLTDEQIAKTLEPFGEMNEWNDTVSFTEAQAVKGCRACLDATAVLNEVKS